MTVSMNPVPNFNTLSVVDATDIIYTQLIPACEEIGIKLSQYGNHGGRGSLVKVDSYDAQKETRTLFDVPRIQRIFGQLEHLLAPTAGFETNSYGLKHSVERIQKEYATNGDLIVAMLMKGYEARFAEIGELLGVNCEFNARLIVPEPR